MVIIRLTLGTWKYLKRHICKSSGNLELRIRTRISAQDLKTIESGIQTPANINKCPLPFGTVIEKKFIEA